MFCVYHMHRKSHEPEIFYIDKTARMPLATSNKKVGYMKALSADHDMYDWTLPACMTSNASCCSQCISTTGPLYTLCNCCTSTGIYQSRLPVSLRTDCHVTYALMLVIVVVASDVLSLVLRVTVLLWSITCIVQSLVIDARMFVDVVIYLVPCKW